MQHQHPIHPVRGCDPYHNSSLSHLYNNTRCFPRTATTLTALLTKKVIYMRRYTIRHYKNNTFRLSTPVFDAAVAETYPRLLLYKLKRSNTINLSKLLSSSSCRGSRTTIKFNAPRISDNEKWFHSSRRADASQQWVIFKCYIARCIV